MRERTFTFLALALLVCASCKSAGWTTHKTQQFTVEAPVGWQVTPDAQTGRVTVSGPARQLAIIWPVFIAEPLDSPVAPGILARLVASAGFRAALGAPRAIRNGVRAYGEEGDRAVTATLVWSQSSSGTAAFLYLAAAPRSAYAAEVDSLARIFESFRAAGPVAGREDRTGAKFAWVRFEDPRERAFSLETPAGWQTEGGLVRAASVDVRKAVKTVSPDGKIRITGGDAQLPPFVEPNQMLEWTGFREGSWYNSGYGVNSLVRRYMTGAQFAREYVTQVAAKDCAGVNFTEAKDRPDVDEPLNRLMAPLSAAGGVMQIRSGEVRFNCVWNGQPAAGYYFAGSLRAGVANSQLAIWHIEYLYGYLAVQGQESAAQDVLGHMLSTYRESPEWTAMQSRVTASTSRIVAQTQETVSRMISDSFNYKNRVGDEVRRRQENATLGTVDVVDPVTGREYKVENSSNYYWLDNRGVIAGTETSTNPGWNFREMVARP